MNHSVPKGNPCWVLLVVSTPFEKYARQNGFIFPNFQDENTQIFELPPSRLGTVGYLGGLYKSTGPNFPADVLGENKPAWHRFPSLVVPAWTSFRAKD